jgi:epoxyqueuosine reductase
MQSGITKKLQSLKNEIKTEALSLGFSHIGFTTPDTPIHYDSFLQWLRDGHAAKMEYLKRPDTIAKRKDPRLLMQTCESIISLALPYTPANHKNDKNSEIKIANYAIGPDYHLIIPELLGNLMEKVRQKFSEVNFEFRIFTDSAPILEKDIAQKAGLGWIGKNSCLINPEAGSYFFLAEIFTNLPFEPDLPFLQDYCGNCSICVDSCPTNCILPARTVNANHCISYLTIENQESITEELRPKIDSWVFGCDICQQVCPWNIRFSKEPAINYFERSEVVQNLEIEKEILVDKKEFEKKFTSSPINRTKYQGYKRNLIVVAGNNFRNHYVDSLKFVIENEEDPMLRKLAIGVIFKNYADPDYFYKILENEIEKDVKQYINNLLDEK